MACSYLSFYKYFLHFELLGHQYYKNESIHLNSWDHSYKSRNRKIVRKHRWYLLIFLLELNLTLGWPYREYIKTVKNGSFCEELLSENDFTVVLANFCCYEFCSASEVVQKISSRTLKLYASSLKQLIL